MFQKGGVFEVQEGFWETFVKLLWALLLPIFYFRIVYQQNVYKHVTKYICNE
jgi:hypothetical protein